jgi:hypothetical protein
MVSHRANQKSVCEQLLEFPVMTNSLIYVSDMAAGTITKYHQDGCSRIVASGLAGPTGLVLDCDGRLLYAAVTGSILKYDAAGNSSVFANGLNGPGGLALDANGNLFVATKGDGTIRRYDPAGHGVSFATGLQFDVSYLTFDQGGNLYASTTHSVKKCDEKGVVSQFYPPTGPSQNYTYGVTFDCSGRLFVSLQNAGTIVGLNGGGIIPPVTPLNFFPGGIALDGENGYLYAACGTTLNRYEMSGTGQVFASGFSSARYLAVFS